MDQWSPSREQFSKGVGGRSECLGYNGGALRRPRQAQGAQAVWRAGALAGRRCTGHTHTHTHASDPPAPPLRPVAAGFSRRRGCCASGAAAAHGAVRGR